MRYEKFPASPGLQPFVKYYFIWEGNEVSHRNVVSPPNCFTILAFNYADPCFEAGPGAQLTPVPDAMACGLFTRHHQFRFSRRTGIAGIALRATALHNFFEWPMSEMVDHWIPMADIMGSAADYMLGAIRSQETDAGRLRVLQHFAASHVTRANSRLCSINKVLAHFEESYGETTFEEVARLLHREPGSLENEFLEKVGLWPDRYRKLLQGMMLENPKAPNEQDWLQLR